MHFYNTRSKPGAYTTHSAIHLLAVWSEIQVFYASITWGSSPDVTQLPVEQRLCLKVLGSTTVKKSAFRCAQSKYSLERTWSDGARVNFFTCQVPRYNNRALSKIPDEIKSSLLMLIHVLEKKPFVSPTSEEVTVTEIYPRLWPAHEIRLFSDAKLNIFYWRQAVVTFHVTLKASFLSLAF